jgi:hypothetical protein
MSNDKQTAVEWLIDKHFGGIENVTPYFKEHIKKAQEIEAEQIKEAWTHGFDWGMMEQSLAEQGEPSTLIDANHFYNETYGGNI